MITVSISKGYNSPVDVRALIKLGVEFNSRMTHFNEKEVFVFAETIRFKIKQSIFY